MSSTKRSAWIATAKSYMSLQLRRRDRCDQLRVFERVDELAPGFQSGDFINMKGFVQAFQGRLQAIGQDIQKARPGEFQIKDLIRSAAETSANCVIA